MTSHLLTTLNLLAWSLAIAWLWKTITAAFGLPRIPNLNKPAYDLSPEGDPSICIIVPACNEAANVTACLDSLFAQDYLQVQGGSKLRIVAINDRSSDATGAILDALVAAHPDKLTVLHITDLPAGWLGKTHAMAVAAEAAIADFNPDFLLFTDADVLFTPDAIRRSLARAVATEADHFITLPTPIIRTRGEGMLLGYLQVMGLWAVRLWRVDDSRNRYDAVGIGAFNMLRTKAYLALGGFASLRMEIIEDVALGRRVKHLGLRQRVAFAPRMVNLHWASGMIGVVNVMTKNLFAVFSFRIAPFLVGCFGFVWLSIAPVVFLFLPATRVPALVTVATIVSLFVISCYHSGLEAWDAVFFPLSATVFVYSMLRSMFITLKDGGVTWRGTFYPLAELRSQVTPML